MSPKWPLLPETQLVGSSTMGRAANWILWFLPLLSCMRPLWSCLRFVVATLVARLRSALCVSSTEVQEHPGRGETPEHYSMCSHMVADTQTQLLSPRWWILLDTGVLERFLAILVLFINDTHYHKMCSQCNMHLHTGTSDDKLTVHIKCGCTDFQTNTYYSHHLQEKVQWTAAVALSSLAPLWPTTCTFP